MNKIERKIAAHAEAAGQSWGSAYGKFAKVIKSRSLKVGVEIGVAFAGHAESLLDGTGVELLYGVDPYKHMRSYDDPMNLPQKEFDVLYKFVLNRMSKFGKRYFHIRGYTQDAKRVVTSPIDFVYIDADHSYEGVWNDIIAWYPLIRNGGIIGGHDYGHTNFPGVKQAIDEFFRRFDWEIHEEGDGVWWVEKKEVPVSFIMPVYNAEQTVIASVESIANSNLMNGDELVMVNDCSTDSTSDKIKLLQKKYNWIRSVDHTINKGGGAARNTAVENAKHKLIFCLDSDNILAKNSVTKLRDFLITSGADIASFESLKYFKTAPSKVTHTWRFKGKSTTFEGALSCTKFPGASGNYLYTKESWARAKRYPETADALDAWGFGMRQVATNSRMTILPNSFYFHRYGHDSYWVRESRKNMVSLTALGLLIPFLDQVEKEDVDYIMGVGRNIWFNQLDSRPIRLRPKDTTIEHTAIHTLTHKKQSFSSRVAKRAIRELRRII